MSNEMIEKLTALQKAWMAAQDEAEISTMKSQKAQMEYNAALMQARIDCGASMRSIPKPDGSWTDAPAAPGQK